MSEDAPKSNSAVDAGQEVDKGEATVTRTRKVPLAVMPVTPFGKYNLIGKLGHGGMAEVFLAYVAGPAGFRKLVVIKRLHQQLEEEPGFLDMFMDEARLAARLNHPNIVQCFEVGDVQGSHFIAMEYLEGQGLDRIRRHALRAEKSIPEKLVVRILVDALEGLHYAHELKDFDGSPLRIVHRDVSPQNVFVTYDGMVKLLDFGIAKATTHVVETRTGVVKGKFAYMAPEQARGGDLDRRADIWSMGVVLWEALTNRRLFKGQNDLATLNQAMVGDIPDIKKYCPDISEPLVEVVRTALAREAVDRYQTALEMKKALEGAAQAGPGLAARSDVAEHVKAMFTEIIEQHRKVLQVCLSDASAQSSMARAGHPFSGTTSDLNMTPGGGVEAIGGYSSPLATPTGQYGSPVSNFNTASGSHTGSGAVSTQHQESGWLGKVALLGGAVVLAVLSTFLVLMFYGPQPLQLSGPSAVQHHNQGSDQPSVQPHEAPAARLTEAEPTTAPTKGAAADPLPAPEADGESDSKRTKTTETAEPAAAEATKVETADAPAVSLRQKEQDRRWQAQWKARRDKRRAQRSQTSTARKGTTASSSANTASSATKGTAQAASSESSGEGSAEQAFGFLTLDTMPWSQVSLDGRSLGTTPLIRVRVPVGSHNLTLRNPELNISTTYRVRITEGNTTTRRLGLR